jgi:hypothetical protein
MTPKVGTAAMVGGPFIGAIGQLLLYTGYYELNEITDDVSGVQGQQAGLWNCLLSLSIETCAETSGNTRLP